MIVQGNAEVASHAHYGSIAVGGYLIDTTPDEHGTVNGLSWADKVSGSFQWHHGVRTGEGIPFSWEDFESLARILQPLKNHIWVIDQGGCYSEDNRATRYYDLYDFVPNGQAAAHGMRLVIFLGEGTIGLKGTSDNRQFGMSVLAPFARVVVDETVGFVDGCVVAKSMGSTGRGVEFHCNCFGEGGPFGAVPLTCGPPPPAPPPCEDLWPTTKCQQKAGKDRCGTSSIATMCEKTCGVCHSCGARNPPPPPPVCELPRSTNSYSLIVRQDAVVGSHAHYLGFAIGGTLFDGTPTEHATVGAKSFIERVASVRGFTYADGVTVGRGFPLDWAAYETIALRLVESQGVHIIDQKGSFSDSDNPSYYYDMYDLFPDGGDNPTAQGYNNGKTLVVFQGAGTIGLKGTHDNRQFGACILAPFARVVVDASVGFIDGVVIAKAYGSKTQLGLDVGVELHGGGGSTCGGPFICKSEEVLLPATSTCKNKLSDKKCKKKAKKCHKKRIKKKCASTCNTCK